MSKIQSGKQNRDDYVNGSLFELLIIYLTGNWCLHEQINRRGCVSAHCKQWISAEQCYWNQDFRKNWDVILFR